MKKIESKVFDNFLEIFPDIQKTPEFNKIAGKILPVIPLMRLMVKGVRYDLNDPEKLKQYKNGLVQLLQTFIPSPYNILAPIVGAILMGLIEEIQEEQKIKEK